MADNPRNEAQSQPSTPTSPVSTQVQELFRAAPMLPVPGAAVASPMTGQGPESFEEEQIQPPAQTVVPHPPRPRGRVVPPPSPTFPAQPVQGVPIPPAPTPAANQSPMMNMMQMLPTGPLMDSLVVQLLNTHRTAGQKFHLLVLPDGGWPDCEEFDNVQGLIERIMALVGTPHCLFPFIGHRCSITSGPYRFLQTPMGQIPLFDVNAGKQETTRFGWVGDSLDAPQAPTAETLDDVAAMAELADVGSESAEPVDNEPAAEASDNDIF